MAVTARIPQRLAPGETQGLGQYRGAGKGTLLNFHVAGGQRKLPVRAAAAAGPNLPVDHQHQPKCDQRHAARLHPGRPRAPAVRCRHGGAHSWKGFDLYGWAIIPRTVLVCCRTTPGPVRLLYGAATVVYASPCVVKYYSLYFCTPVLQSLDLPGSPDLNPMTRHGHSASNAWCQAADRVAKCATGAPGVVCCLGIQLRFVLYKAQPALQVTPDRCAVPQANTSIPANSWGQYVAAMIEYFRVTVRLHDLRAELRPLDSRHSPIWPSAIVRFLDSNPLHMPISPAVCTSRCDSEIPCSSLSAANLLTCATPFSSGFVVRYRERQPRWRRWSPRRSSVAQTFCSSCSRASAIPLCPRSASSSTPSCAYGLLRVTE